ncbi:carbohydrate ABC transporter permease [Paenibacillus alkalitolerans]|uniref:carbohydrate ABC transporter permease n=1 Tax=Paenibacillus alkalitolerans TaxID=2799335 RepID=UPI0018F7A726|nr:carbohydrate ABC transporter permease [Paenibacillus alkalitolerans]
MRSGIHLYPKELSFEAYKAALNSDGIWVGFSNTIFRTVVGTLLSLVLMALTAYPLAKKHLPHRTLFTMVILFTMFFQGGLIPTYLLIQNLGLIDSRWVYILAPPFLINTFSMLIMRNFFMGIPAELEDSAKIDGANDIRILSSIVIPLSKPILATVALWAAVFHWNSWFDGLIYIQDQKKILLQIFLRRLVVENQNQELAMLMDMATGPQLVTPETVKAAVLMVTVLPILLVYPFLQKYFVRGIMIGSLKG